MRFLRLLLVCVLAHSLPAPSLAAERLLVFAAASLTDVLTEMGARYREETSIEVTFSFAGSGALARQIEAGAPADVFMSADRRWMDWMEVKGAVARSDVREFASNRLVIAVRNEIENWADPETLLMGGRFAMGEPESVPAGRYAKQALEKRGLWEQAGKQAVFGENARVTLRRLTLGEVGAAVVYETDALADPGARAIHTFAEDSHEPIVYLAAPVKSGKAGGSDFVEWLGSAAAKTVLEKHGFTLPAGAD